MPTSWPSLSQTERLSTIRYRAPHHSTEPTQIVASGDLSWQSSSERCHDLEELKTKFSATHGTIVAEVSRGSYGVVYTCQIRDQEELSVVKCPLVKGDSSLEHEIMVLGKLHEGENAENIATLTRVVALQLPSDDTISLPECL
jgi:hypothetical protein